jgi:predicted tellurium resistance membrane protein TerC
MELLTRPEAWAALLTLTALEIVLGIDNVIFLSVIVSRIPPEQAKRARQIGLLLALVADGFKFHIPRGYIYFAIVFSTAVELFNVLARRNRRKVAS